MNILQDKSIENFYSYLSLRNVEKFYFYYEDSYFLLAEAIHKKSADFGLQVLPLKITTTTSTDFAANFSTQVGYIFAYDILQRKIPIPEYLTDLRTHLKKLFSTNIVTLININSYFNEIFSSPYTQIANLHKNLIQHAQKSKMMYVTDQNGTSLEIELNKAKWSNIDGSTMSFDFLPSEIANCPTNANGIVYFTGGFLSPLPLAQKYGLIRDSIKLTITNRRIVDIETENSQLKKDLLMVINKNEGNALVEEAGIGTNSGVQLFGIGLPFEERYSGFHLGIGGELTNSLHWDMIFSNSTIMFDNDLIFSSDSGFTATSKVGISG